MFSVEELKEIRWAIRNGQYPMGDDRKRVRASVLHKIENMLGLINIA